MRAREIIVVDDDRFGRLDVERLAAVPPGRQLMPVFVPIGAGREEWERAREVEAEYLAPGRAA